MDLSVDPKAPQSLYWLTWDLLVGLDFLQLFRSEKHIWPSLTAVSIFGSQAAYPTFYLVQLTSGHPLTCTLSLAPVAGTTDTWTSVPCGPHSSCWHHRQTDPCDLAPVAGTSTSINTRMRNRGPLIQE